MARREIFVDDLDGREHESVQTRNYSIGHQSYTIDLSDKNYEEFLKAFEKYTAVSERVSRSAPKAPRSITAARPSKTNEKGYSASDVREWAKAKGIEVSERGRIHKDIVEKFEYAKGLDK